MANDSIQKMKTLVLERLTSDLEASDCLVCLFWSALSSYRYDTVLRPFPQMFTLEDGRKDIDGLRAVFETFTDLLSIKQNIDNLNVTSLTFLHWILCTRSFKVTTLPVSEFDVISKLTPHSTHNVEPYKIFKVVHSVEQERKWSELAKDFETFLAYHGSRFENFHSIIHNGLLSHMNKVMKIMMLYNH
jgi:poly[ADP-ribose] polymerase 16